MLAETVVNQHYVNYLVEPALAEYTFPLLQVSTLRALVATVGSRTCRGVLGDVQVATGALE
jgi:hypothetical protein